MTDQEKQIAPSVAKQTQIIMDEGHGVKALNMLLNSEKDRLVRYIELHNKEKEKLKRAKELIRKLWGTASNMHLYQHPDAMIYECVRCKLLHEAEHFLKEIEDDASGES